jgi:hypothetical protein
VKSAFLLLSITLLVFGANRSALADQVADFQFAAAKELRKQLPMKADELTTLVTVASAGRMLMYSFRVEIEKERIPSDFIGKQEANLKHNLCAHPTMRKVMKKGASYSYLYTDIRGKFVAEIKVKNSDC